jgi:hypothetical protein
MSSKDYLEEAGGERYSVLFLAKYLDFLSEDMYMKVLQTFFPHTNLVR